MKTYQEMRKEMMKDPEVRAEVERLEREEMPMLDAILKARKATKMSQKDIAEKMGVAPPVVSRLENSLITGKHSPSVATLKRYAAAMGKRLEIRFV
jgi:predicted transcriptional regulator